MFGAKHRININSFKILQYRSHEKSKFFEHFCQKIAKNLTNRPAEHKPKREMSVLNCVKYVCSDQVKIEGEIAVTNGHTDTRTHTFRWK